jgi:c-di-GMP-binding flagellar brake protein YcgR
MENKISFTPDARIIIEFPSLFKRRYYSAMRGYKQEQYIIIDHPEHNKRLLPLEEGMVCMVRYIEGGLACGFKSQVLGTALRPYPLAFLDFPNQVESSNLRQEERYPVSLAGSFVKESTEENSAQTPQVCDVINISGGGCLITSPESIETETTLLLTISLPEEGDAEGMETEVKSCVKSDSEYSLGLNFSDLLNPAYKKVTAYLDNLRKLQVRV